MLQAFFNKSGDAIINFLISSSDCKRPASSTVGVPFRKISTCSSFVNNIHNFSNKYSFGLPSPENKVNASSLPFFMFL